MKQHPNQVPQTSTMAVISLVTALLCIPLVSIILGHLARSEVRKSNGTIAGAGIALAGLIIGYLQVVAWVLFLISLIGGLGLVASNMQDTFEGGQEDAARNWVDGAGKQYIELHFLKTRSYPDSLDDLMESPRGGVSPVVEKPSVLMDPWGNQYQYRYPGEENPDSFDLWTVTPDGQTIGNWD
jgi:general secretion pathway protein G